MKIRFLIPGLVIVLATSAARADEQPADKLRVLSGEPGAGKRVERHVFIRHADDPDQMETVPFLGIETARASAVLTSQLNLPKGTGLVVREVVADGPSAQVLQANDVLTKLEDQTLIEGRQLSVLVRNRKVGDEVTLSYIRGGKPATAKVKLGQHQVRKIADLDFSGGPPHEFVLPLPGGRAEMDHVLPLIEPDDRLGGESPMRIPLPGKAKRGLRSSKVDVANSNMTFTDDQGTLELTTKGGAKSLVAKNPAGEELFSGPIETPEQREKLPPAIRERLKKLDTMEEFEFRVGEPGAHELKVFRPEPTRFERALPVEPREQRHSPNKI